MLWSQRSAVQLTVESFVTEWVDLLIMYDATICRHTLLLFIVDGLNSHGSLSTMERWSSSWPCSNHRQFNLNCRATKTVSTRRAQNDFAIDWWIQSEDTTVTLPRLSTFHIWIMCSFVAQSCV